MKPILFNTEMIKAILNGRKTTTRRIMKPKCRRNFIGTDFRGLPMECRMVDIDTQEIVRQPKVPYQIGDVLYVRETWKCTQYNNMNGDLPYGVTFRADGKEIYAEFQDNERYEKFRKFASKNGWQSPYFMPVECARIFLHVTDVKAVRLQNITDAGAKAEGAKERRDFIRIWNNTIPDKDSQQLVWSANPWVWVISFERCKKPCDAP